MAKTCIVMTLEIPNVADCDVLTVARMVRTALKAKWPVEVGAALPGEKLSAYTLENMKPFLPRRDE